MKTIKLHTDGLGYWSNIATDVTVNNMQLGYVNSERTFGELCVYFANNDEDAGDWIENSMGLIYTDKLFLTELNAYLVTLGLYAVEYSEQGMQGNNYVSCDVSEEFLTAWDIMHNTVPA